MLSAAEAEVTSKTETREVAVNETGINLASSNKLKSYETKYYKFPVAPKIKEVHF